MIGLDTRTGLAIYPRQARHGRSNSIPSATGVARVRVAGLSPAELDAATLTETPLPVWDFGDNPPAPCGDLIQNEILHAKKRYVDNTGRLYVERFDTTANSAKYVQQWQTCAIALSEQDGSKPTTASGTTNGVHWTADSSAGHFQYGNVVTLVR